MIEPTQEKRTIGDGRPVRVKIDPRLKAILKLDPLERFVFVTSVLEGYSYQDTSLLLGCSRQVVMKAWAPELEHLANAARYQNACFTLGEVRLPLFW
jgi:hypothetical protein